VEKRSVAVAARTDAQHDERKGPLAPASCQHGLDCGRNRRGLARVQQQ
jgi:hypothetical protein